jgi:hypothetical protein
MLSLGRLPTENHAAERVIPCYSARTGRGSGKRDTTRLTYHCQSSCVLFSCLTFGFSGKAKLDEGAMWPTAFALKELTAAEEARIGALEKKAVS